MGIPPSHFKFNLDLFWCIHTSSGMPAYGWRTCTDMTYRQFASSVAPSANSRLCSPFGTMPCITGYKYRAKRRLCFSSESTQEKLRLFLAWHVMGEGPHATQMPLCMMVRICALCLVVRTRQGKPCQQHSVFSGAASKFSFETRGCVETRQSSSRMLQPTSQCP